MSALLISRPTDGVPQVTGRTDGPIAGTREYWFGALRPLCASSMPASPPCVHALRHPGVRRYIGVVPQPAFHRSVERRGVVDLHLFRAHHCPATFGLHPPHLRQRGRVPVPHAVAVGHLEEAVAGHLGADANRFEEDVVARLAHALSLAEPSRE